MDTAKLTLQIPYFKVEMQESKFGLGVNFDTIAIEPHDQNQRWNKINPLPVVAFIEGILGYSPVPITNTAGGIFWEYRREEGFGS